MKNNYHLVERDGKTFCEPIDKERGNFGIGEAKGRLVFNLDSNFPSEHIICPHCDVYGLIHRKLGYGYDCANCDNFCLPSPKMLHVFSSSDAPQ